MTIVLIISKYLINGVRCYISHTPIGGIRMKCELCDEETDVKQEFVGTFVEDGPLDARVRWLCPKCLTEKYSWGKPDDAND